MSLDEYLALDRASEERWEYVGSEGYAMAGASPRHNAIVMNITLVIGNALRGKTYFPLGSDQKIETTATRGFHYPDIAVFCGRPRFSTKDEHGITNPTLLIEIASPSTA